MTRKILASILVLFSLSACAQESDRPVSSDSPAFPPPPSDYAPRAGDSDLERGEAFLDSVELLTLESFPLQFTVSLAGSLPTPCHELRISISAPDPGNRIAMEVYSVTNPGQACISILESFEANIPLGSFATGRYSLWINGEKFSEFDA
jgi:hypothetical protein